LLLRGKKPTAGAQCQPTLRSSGLTPGPPLRGIAAELHMLRACTRNFISFAAKFIR